MAKPGPKPKNFTDRQLCAAIKGSGGLMTQIARNLRCDWITARKYVRASEKAQLAIQAEREAILDNAEAQLVNQVNAGESWAVKFTLSTIGKDRGFTERSEISGPGGEPIEVKVTFED